MSLGVHPSTLWRMMKGIFPLELAIQARCEHLQPIPPEDKRISQKYQISIKLPMSVVFQNKLL